MLLKKEILRRQLSEEAEKLAEELRQRKVDEAANKSMKTFQAAICGGGLHIFNKEVSNRTDCTRQQLLDKHDGFKEQFSHLCQHWEAEKQSWVYNQQQKLGEMLEETETVRN